MKRSEHCIQSMILLRKVVSLKKIYLNESHWLYTLQIYTVQKSRVVISHTLMEISVNPMSFADFFKEMLTSLISFSSRYTFSLNLLLKASVVQAKNYGVLKVFLCGQPYWLRDISETFENFRMKVHHKNVFSYHVIYSF